MTSVCKNTLSVKHILLECPITTELFQKNGYDLNAYNNVRDILLSPPPLHRLPFPPNDYGRWGIDYNAM